MNRKFLLLLVGILLMVTGCGSDPNEQGTGEEEVTAVDVEKKYQQKCSMCHGVNLDDGRGNVPELATIGSRMSQGEIEKIILDGIGTMPGGQLKGNEAAAVAEWLAEKK